MAVAHLEGFEDQFLGLVGVYLEDAVAELGDGVAVVEFNIRYSHAAHSTQSMVTRAETGNDGLIESQGCLERGLAPKNLKTTKAAPTT